MILEDQMRGPINSYLEELSSGDEIDRRNGSYSRHLLTELGDLELQVPRAPVTTVGSRGFEPMPPQNTSTSAAENSFGFQRLCAHRLDQPQDRLY